MHNAYQTGLPNGREIICQYTYTWIFMKISTKKEEEKIMNGIKLFQVTEDDL